ncbi:MAG: hypothetical protein WDW38_008160 [Sanguina aurantia]
MSMACPNNLFSTQQEQRYQQYLSSHSAPQYPSWGALHPDSGPYCLTPAQRAAPAAAAAVALARTSTSLYIKNLPLEADNLFMYETFSPYGAILSVKVLVNEETGKCRGVGFVNFSDRAAALRAVQCLNGAVVGGVVLSVSLQGQQLVPRAHTPYAPKPYMPWLGQSS